FYMFYWPVISPFHDPNLMEMYKKIGKGEFKFPNWFAPEVRKLLSKILDPNPNTRISIAKIMGSSWLRRELNVKPQVNTAEEVNEGDPLDLDAVFVSTAEDRNSVKDQKPEMEKPLNLNAFDIISLSSGFDLSGLFEEADLKKEVRFTSNKPASVIISKLQDIAKCLKLKIKKKDRGLLKIEGCKEGRKGAVCIDAEIFEVTPSFHIVEMKKSNGDTLEYRKIMKDNIRPALKDVVWTWQGEHEQQRRQLLPAEQQQQGHEAQQQSSSDSL
ncbi:hypothetical protein Csa_023761, partial [Cucumis sativus]